MAPMVTNVKKPFNPLTDARKTRFEAQFKESGVLLEPKEFKAWRSKLDKLKQVVRVVNP